MRGPERPRKRGVLAVLLEKDEMRPRDLEVYEIGLDVPKNEDEWVNYVRELDLADLGKRRELQRIVAPYELRYDPDFKILS